MFRVLLLFAGLLLIAIDWCFAPIPYYLQMILFVAGLITVGIPHGGADRLIAIKTSGRHNLNFSSQRFTLVYCGQILLFFLFFYLFPHLAILLFLLLSAYHFGETDIPRIHPTKLGKLVRLTYGMFILGMILLPNFSSVQATLIHLNPYGGGAAIIQWTGQHHTMVLLIIFALFGISMLTYSLMFQKHFLPDWKATLRFLLLLVIIYQLPLLLSFTFYFIFWHSISSLKRMVIYLLEDQSFDHPTVFKEIFKNSLIVLAGICLVSYTSSFFFKNADMALYAIIGLAALTGSHMHVAHGMHQHYTGSQKT